MKPQRDICLWSDGGGQITETLYGFYYCSCTYESAHALMSLHRTAKGAYIAMKKHRLENFNEWRRRPNRFRKDFVDTFALNWMIRKIEIQD